MTRQPSAALFLALCILGGLLFLALLSAGQRAVCAVNGDDGPRYCQAAER